MQVRRFDARMGKATSWNCECLSNQELFFPSPYIFSELSAPRAIRRLVRVDSFQSTCIGAEQGGWKGNGAFFG